jgi:hypothetical protein
MRFREPRRLARAALALWVLWAVVAWNVVFDHVIELAGRQYVGAAAQAARTGGPFARVENWMRPAVTSGFWTASATALAILTVGWLGIRLTGAWNRPCA